MILKIIFSTGKKVIKKYRLHETGNLFHEGGCFIHEGGKLENTYTI